MNRKKLQRPSLPLLALCLCLFASAALGEAAPATALPAVGDQIGGFTVTSVTPMDVLGATGVLLEHEKTGAKLLYLASEDTNVAFDITFRTPALDEKGKPHVFEHITIGGSQKYPDANMFFPFANQTYNTFVNACTYHGMTSYPLSSRSEEQLLPMMDYYLSGVFQPLLYTEPRTVSREAWRYELSDPDAPLTIAGTVYSEMQGALTIDRLASANLTSTLFKGGLTAHVSGGRPEAIRTLTYDELLAFHDTYYHPSNALIVLYGKLDYQRFISYIDTEYLSQFDRREIVVERGQVEPYGETIYETYQAPVEAGAQTENASYLHYGFTSNDITLKDLLGLNVLVSYLNSDSSAVMRLLDERLPGAVCGVSIDTDQPAPLLAFAASAVNPEDRDTFVQAVDDGIAQIAAEGVPQAEFEATLSQLKLGLMLTSEDSTLGVDAAQSIALYWTYFDTVDFYSEYEKLLNQITADDLAALLRTYLADNSYRGVATTSPAPGLAEQNAARLEQELADKKASMTQAEIQQMVADAQSFAQWSSAPADSQLVQQLVNMTVEKLPEEIPEYQLREETVDGVRVLTTAVEVGDVAQTSLYLDASALPVEQLMDAALCTQLLGSLDTAAHTREELDTLVSRYLGYLVFGLGAQRSYAPEVPVRYAFSVTTLGLGENAERGLELVREILLDTDFTKMEDIKNQLNQSLYSIRVSVDDALSIQVGRCAAVFDIADAYNNYISGVSMYDYLKDMLALADSDPAALTARLTQARDALLNGQNATLIAVGSASAMEAYRMATLNLASQLPKQAIQPVDYSSLRLSMTSEAVVNNTTVHMNVALAPTEGFTGKGLPISALINDKYLLPQLRNAMGAYGAYINLGQVSDILYTYRDPNLTASFDVFDQLPEYLRTVALTQADVDSYIIGSYNNLLPSGGVLSQALTAVSQEWMGLTRETRLRWLQEAKATTVEDVRAQADKIAHMLETGVRSTSGVESVIMEHRELFDSVLKLDGE